MKTRNPRRYRLLSAASAAAILLASATAMAPADAAVAKPLDIVKIRYDLPGRDWNGNRNWNQEYIQVKNTGRTTLNLTGYRLKDKGPHAFTFPRGTKLAAGKTLTIRSGTGKNGGSTLYWQSRGYVWNNDADRATLLNAQGRILEQCSYKGTHRSSGDTKYC